MGPHSTAPKLVTSQKHSVARLPRRGVLQLGDDAENEPQLGASPCAYRPCQTFLRAPACPGLLLCHR